MTATKKFRQFRLGLASGACAGLIFIYYSGRFPEVGDKPLTRDELVPVASDSSDIQSLVISDFQSPSTDRSVANTEIAAAVPVEPPPQPLAPVDLLDNWLEWSVFEEHLANERVDSAWATRMEGQIYSELTSRGLELSAMRAHCRTTMCRIEVVIVDQSRSLELSEIGQAMMPAIKAAMSTTGERWFIPSIASSTMPLEHRMLSDAEMPPRTRAWIAYVYDMNLLPSTLPTDLPEHVRQAREERERARSEAAEEAQEQLPRNVSAEESPR